VLAHITILVVPNGPIILQDHINYVYGVDVSGVLEEMRHMAFRAENHAQHKSTLLENISSVPVGNWL
jgi:hypothetical protein